MIDTSKANIYKGIKPWSSLVEGDEGSYLTNCQSNLVIALHALSLLLYNFINTTAYCFGPIRAFISPIKYVIFDSSGHGRWVARFTRWVCNLQFESRQEKMDESEDELINEANGVINVASDKLQMHEIGMRPMHNKLRFVISKAPINYRLSWTTARSTGR